MKLSDEEREALMNCPGGWSQHVIDLCDAQHLALRNVRLLAEALDVAEDDDADNIDCAVDGDLIAADLFTALNGLGEA
jgi:hypothetical protein